MNKQVFIVTAGNYSDYAIRACFSTQKQADEYVDMREQEKYWKDPAGGRPAYFVPANELNDMETLRGCAPCQTHQSRS